MESHYFLFLSFDEIILHVLFTLEEQSAYKHSNTELLAKFANFNIHGENTFSFMLCKEVA